MPNPFLQDLGLAPSSSVFTDLLEKKRRGESLTDHERELLRQALEEQRAGQRRQAAEAGMLPAAHTGAGEAVYLEAPEKPWWDRIGETVGEGILKLGESAAAMPERMVDVAEFATEAAAAIPGVEFSPLAPLAAARNPEAAEALREKARPLAEAGKSIAPEAPEGFLQEVTQGVAGALPDLALQVGATALNPAAGVALAVGQVGGASYREKLDRAKAGHLSSAEVEAIEQEMEDSPLSRLAGGSKNAALLAAALEGAIAGPLEATGAKLVHKALLPAGLGARAGTPGTLDIAMRRLGQRQLLAGGGEALTEGMQELVAVAGERATGRKVEASEAWHRALIASVSGGVLGAGAASIARPLTMTQEEYQTAKARLREELYVNHNLPKEAFDAFEQRQTDFVHRTMAAGHLTSALEVAEREYLKTHPSETPAALGEKLHRWLTNPPEDRPTIPEELRQFVAPLREFQDSLSNDIRAEPELLTEGEQDNFEEGLGKYLYRGFAIHDDPLWVARMRGEGGAAPDPIYLQGKESMATMFQEDAEASFRRRLQIEGRTPDEIETSWAAAEPQILAQAAQKGELFFDAFLDKHSRIAQENADAIDPLSSTFASAGMVTKDLSILKHRKEFEEPILAALGEYTDPKVAFLKSIERATRTLTAHRMYRAIRDGALRTGRATVGPGEGTTSSGAILAGAGRAREVDPMRDLLNFIDEPQAAETWTVDHPVAQAIGQQYGPEAAARLAEGPQIEFERGPRDPLGRTEEGQNVFYDPELYDALDHSMRQHHTTALMKINGLVKMGFTVLSPQTQARNVWSNLLALTAGGNLFIYPSPTLGFGNLLKGMRATASGLEILDYGKVTDRALERRRIFMDAVDYGVTGKNADLGDIDYYLGAYADSMERKGGVLQYALKGSPARRRTSALPFKSYQWGDDSFKVPAWWAETKKYQWVGFSEEAAKTHAAEIVKRTMQNYDRQPRIVQRLKRTFPFGPFISFPVAAGINLGNQAIQARSDIFNQHEDPKIRRRLRLVGMHRLGGLSAALSAVGLAAKGLTHLMLSDDDEGLSRDEKALKEQRRDEAAREFLPFYLRNSQLAFVRQEPGRLTMLDFGYMNYFGIAERPITAFLTHGSEEKLQAALGELAASFTSEEPLMGMTFDLMRNKDIYGAHVYNPASSLSKQAEDVARHVTYLAAPGAIRTGTRMYRGYSGWSDDRGRAYDFGTEALAVVGPRAITLDFVRAVEGRARFFQHGKGLTTRILTEATRKPIAQVSEQDLRFAAREAHHAIKMYYDKMLGGIQAARWMDVGDDVLLKALQRGGIAKKGQTKWEMAESRKLLDEGVTAEDMADAWMTKALPKINDRRAQKLAREIEIEETRPQISDPDRVEELKRQWAPLDLPNLYR